MQIIGIGGLSRSGKDTLAELLVEKGYFGISLGDIIRNKSRKRHVGEPDPISVANMTETANWLRQEKGSDFALKEAINQIQPPKSYKGLVLFSVRAPAEVDFIKQAGGKVIWVEAGDEVRYQRFRQNRRPGEAKISLAQFIAQENLQSQPQPGIPSEAQMNAKYVRTKADIFIENNGNDIEVFKDAAKKALAVILG